MSSSHDLANDPADDDDLAEQDAEVVPNADTRRGYDTRGWIEELQGACSLLAELPAGVAEVFERRLREVRYAPGDYLIRQGDPGNSLLVIRSGVVKVGATDEQGRQRWIARTGRGQVLGEMSLLTGEPRTADVIAVKPVRAMVLAADEFHRLARRHPEISVVLTNIVARRLGAAEHDVLAGKTLGGWLVHGRLGKGGMSVVYEAEDQHGRRAALKMMSHRLVYDEMARRQFQREADLVRSFDHPGIVRLYDRFAAFHTYFLAMEFCDGRPLDQVLRQSGPLPESEVRKIVGQVAAAMDYAHRKGVIHRDVKPANIMAMRDGTIKLMDFGLAQPVDEIPNASEGTVVGTPAYMAPEQLLGHPLTSNADLFALGLMIWEMLAGRRLLEKVSLGELLRLHSRWKPPNAREKLPHLSEEVASLIETCLAAAPEDREVDLAHCATWAAPLELPSHG